MRSVFAFLSFVFATTSLASPALEQRQETCLPDLTARFELTASRFGRNETISLRVTDVPSAPPGSASVLAVGPPGAFFRLESGRIPTDSGVQQASYGARAGTPVTFTQLPGFPSPVEPYCAQRLPDADTPYLGVDGNIRDFAICEAFGGVRQVVYKPAPDNAGSYRIETCVGALVKIREVEE